MQIFKREYNLPTLEFVKYQLNRSINVPVPSLNDTDITVLAYVYVYGDDTHDKIIEHRILTSRNSCVNYIVKFKRMGYVIKDEQGLRLQPNLKITNEPFTEVSIVKPTDEERVFHPFFQAPAQKPSQGVL